MSSYTPKYGGITSVAGGDQFPASRISSLSYRVTPIEFVDRDSAHATGFFWYCNERTYVVTNWHVVTLQNPFNGTCLTRKDDFSTPQRIRIFGTRWASVDNNPSYGVMLRFPVEIDLFADQKPNWLQHERFETERIDLAAIEIPNDTIQCRNGGNAALNGFGFGSLFNLVGADVYALGYPFKSYEGSMTAIWKRGSIASEPLLSIDGRPMFLVDMLGTKGMSGSPIVRRVLGPMTLLQLHKPTLTWCP